MEKVGINLPHVHHPPIREIPESVYQKIIARETVVEDLADIYRAKGWKLCLNFGRFTNPANWSGLWIGPIVTARYIPRAVPGPDYRLGHEEIARACPPGAIVVVDADQCQGSVLGGNAAATLKQGGAAACVVNGMGRDFPEIIASGLIARTRDVGVEGGRDCTELGEVGNVIVVNGVPIRPNDIGIMNAWGLALIPEWIAWEELLTWLEG